MKYIFFGLLVGGSWYCSSLHGIGYDKELAKANVDIDSQYQMGEQSAELVINGSETNLEVWSQINLKSTTLTQKKLINQYRPDFEALQTQVTDEIDALIASALTEFRLKRENEEDISYYYFLQKYTKEAEYLETKTDEAFGKLYSALQKDLRANGHDPNAAAEINSHYQAEKAARKNAIFDKVMDLLL